MGTQRTRAQASGQDSRKGPPAEKFTMDILGRSRLGSAAMPALSPLAPNPLTTNKPKGALPETPQPKKKATHTEVRLNPELSPADLETADFARIRVIFGITNQGQLILQVMPCEEGTQSGNAELLYALARKKIAQMDLPDDVTTRLHNFDKPDPTTFVPD